MKKRINWQREVGQRRRMVEMVEGEETGTRDVLRGQIWKTNEVVAERWNEERDQERMEQRKNELMGGGRHNV